MAKTDSKDLQSHFVKCLSFLRKYQFLHIYPVTRVLNEGLLSKIPKEWSDIVSGFPLEELNNLPFAADSAKSDDKNILNRLPQSLLDFLSEASTLSLARTQDVTVASSATTPVISLDQHLAKGMNPKKRHEVERMASLVDRVATEAGCDLVVDIGSGLGYLDHILHQRYAMVRCLYLVRYSLFFLLFTQIKFGRNYKCRQIRPIINI